MIAKNPPTTAEELLAAGAEYDRFELVRGEVRPMSPPGVRHGVIVLRIGARLLEFVDREKLGVVVTESGVILSRNPDTMRGPDLSFFHRDQIPTEGIPTGFSEVIPDLVVEVASPNDQESDLAEKVREYIQAGVRLVWVIRSTNQSATAYRGDASAMVYSGDQVITGEDVLPGFECRVGEFFQ